MANKRKRTLYIGVTCNLIKRVYEHKSDLIDGFTKKYNVHHLVFYEQVGDFEAAMRREKQLKKWNRLWKLRIIEQMNPDWRDLYDTLV